ncbi:MAG: hypothetical protein ACR2JW_20425 [Thermomicrobiales bacterium]
MAHHPEVERLARASWAFYEPIRYRQGFKQAAFDELCEAIRVCTERWRDAEEIPKVLAWLLANYTFNIIANKDVASWYPLDEAQRIHEAAWTIHSLIGRCFIPSAGVQNEYLPLKIPKKGPSEGS